MTDADSEWRRVSSARSPVILMAAHVANLRLMADNEVPMWLTRLAVPMGWRVGRYNGLAAAPWRVAVTGPHDDGGWDGCETITVYMFDGVIPLHALDADADVALRDLDAADITTTVLYSDHSGAVVRSSGYLAAGGVWIRALHSYFATEGMLIHQSIYVDVRADAALSPGVEQLSREVRSAFDSRSL